MIGTNFANKFGDPSWDVDKNFKAHLILPNLFHDSPTQSKFGKYTFIIKKLAGMNIVSIHRHCIDIHNSAKLDQHIHHQLRY